MSNPAHETPDSFEFLDVRAEWEGARWQRRFGVFGTPVVAALWASTSSAARAIDAGQLDPRQILHDADKLQLVWDAVWLTGYAVLGTRGLHVVFGAIVAAAITIGVVGWARVRALERRHGAERFREAERAEFLREFLRSRPELAEKFEAAKSGPRSVVRPSGVLWTHAILFRLAPIAAIALTMAFVWMALRS